jgi:hypothetical protein
MAAILGVLKGGENNGDAATGTDDAAGADDARRAEGSLDPDAPAAG